MAITLPPESTKQLLGSIKRYVAEHFDQDIGEGLLLSARRRSRRCLLREGVHLLAPSSGAAQGQVISPEQRPNKRFEACGR